MKQIIILVLFLATHASSPGQVRTTKDWNDYEFLERSVLDFAKDLDSDVSHVPFEIEGHDFSISFNIKREDYNLLRKQMYGGAHAIANVMYWKVLRYFPEFHTMTIKSRSRDHKQVSITYHFLPNNCVGFVDESGKPVVLRFEMGNPGGKIRM